MAAFYKYDDDGQRRVVHVCAVSILIFVCTITLKMSVSFDHVTLLMAAV